MQKIPILITMLLALTFFMPSVSFANKTVNVCQNDIQNWENVHAEIKALREQVKTSAEKVAKLTNALNDSQNGKTVQKRIAAEIVDIRRPSDGQNAGMLNIWDTSAKINWHITNRSDSNNDLKFILWDGKIFHGRFHIKKDGGILVFGNADVRGNIQAKNFQYTSDQRHKQNIQTIRDSLTKLAQLRGVSFNWKDNPKEKQIGLVAQEVEKIFPELVSTDNKGYKSIDYGKFTAVLLEGFKEQQLQIEELKSMVKP
ncbi:tail fiber domain-containing protein [Candidatus Parabeggiatoa sp. HSG14]|uniref:tail fiber domain-containing protein n=1 Tax=Candidatus Parabeggiatoa sp. HSG14 TaxID=3055593 RepID=UPI0025A8E900|nr:tail fiber domain-containing protein [Thiotrichales bacterium HSG14]